MLRPSLRAGTSKSEWKTLQEPLGAMSDDAETNPDLYDWNAVPPSSCSSASLELTARLFAC